MYSTSSGRGFLPLVTAAHEISPTCSCMRNPGEEECMIHIREIDTLAVRLVLTADRHTRCSAGFTADRHTRCSAGFNCR